MDTTTDLVIGQVVKSKAGRDKDKLFAIIDIIDLDFVLLADGKYRKLKNPKKKKIKHLMVYNSIVEGLSEKANTEVNDSYIRKALAPFTK